MIEIKVHRSIDKYAIYKERDRYWCMRLTNQHETKIHWYCYLSEAFNRVVSDLGGLDILFNNAGVHGYVEPRERVIGVNLVRWRLAQWGWNKMADIAQTTFSNLILYGYYYILIRILLKISSEWSNGQYAGLIQIMASRQWGKCHHLNQPCPIYWRLCRAKRTCELNQPGELKISIKIVIQHKIYGST